MARYDVSRRSTFAPPRTEALDVDAVFDVGVAKFNDKKQADYAAAKP